MRTQFKRAVSYAELGEFDVFVEICSCRSDGVSCAVIFAGKEVCNFCIKTVKSTRWILAPLLFIVTSATFELEFVQVGVVSFLFGFLRLSM